MRVLVFADLKAKGISYTRKHVGDLVRRKIFPAPFKLGGDQNNPNAINFWDEAEVDAYLEAAKASRGALTAAQSEPEKAAG
jgi:predicted DNA-binding transcriptional regulator AlpA